MERMATAKRTAPARSKMAVTKTITELTEAIATTDAALEELNARQTTFLQNSYVSQKVHHRIYGDGIVVEQKEDILKVSFPKTDTTRSFVIHGKFVNRPVFDNDEEVIAAFSEFADRRQTIMHLKQERMRMEKQRAALMLSDS